MFFRSTVRHCRSSMDGSRVQNETRGYIFILGFDALKRTAILLCSFFLFNHTAWAEQAAKPPPKNPQLWKVATGMEAVFVRQILQSMRKATPESGIMAQSPGAKIYRSMLDSKYADIIGQRGDIGIADMVYDYLDGESTYENNR